MQKQMMYKNTGKFNPQVIEEILEVKKKEGLTPESLLKKAKNKGSELHPLFDWDNKSASEKWRLQQARLLINEVKVIVEDKELAIFENVVVNISSDKDNPQYRREYKDISEIMSNEDWKQQTISKALTEVSYWKEKYERFTELNPIFVSIEKQKKKWQNKK